MFPLTHNQFLKFAAAGAIVAFTAASTPASADEMVQNLGPVGPNEPILVTVGSKRVIAFYVAGSGTCALQAVVWDRKDIDAKTAAGIRVSLQPGQFVHIDSSEKETLNLQCGSHAETLSVIDNDERVAFDIATQKSDQTMRANASGF